MAMGVMEIAAVTRSQDYTTIKHNEDNKAMTDQTNIGAQVQKTAEQNQKQVRESDNADNRQRRFDAREKGGNEYSGDGGKNRRKNAPHEQVVVKDGRKSFDVKI